MKEDIQLKNEWIKHYGLTALSTSKYYKVIGCFIVGFEQIKTQGEIQPHFMIYPLWESNVKNCFITPLVLHCVEDSRGFRYQLPVLKILESTSTIFQDIDRFLDFDMRYDVHKADILKIVDYYISFEIRNPYVQINMIELKIIMATYLKDDLLFERTKDQMDEMYSKVGKEDFEYCADCKYDEWVKKQVSYYQNRQNVLDKINENIANSKIKERVELLP